MPRQCAWQDQANGGYLKYVTVRPADIVLAASDSSAFAKNQADFVCDAVNDKADIEAAMALLGASGGPIPGRVFLHAGTYYVSELFAAVSYDDFALVGSGPGTVLKMPDGADGARVVCIVITARFLLADMSIDANKAQQAGNPHGLELLASGYGEIRGVYLRNCGDAIKFWNGSVDNIITQCRVVENCAVGIRINASADGYNLAVANNLRAATTPIVDNGTGSVVDHNV